MKMRKIMFVAAVLLIIVLGFFSAKYLIKTTATGTEPQSTNSAIGMYAYGLAASEIGDGWQLVQEYKNLAEWPLEQQKTFAADGIADAAGWKYAKGNETLYIWARNFADVGALVTVEKEKVGVEPYKGDVLWKDVSELPQYGELARIGVFDARSNKEYTSLFLYVAQGTTMFFVQYTNQIFNGHDRYEKELAEGKSTLFNDKRFLINIFKKIGAKPAAEN